MFITMAPQMIRHRILCGLDGVRLGVDIGGNASRMASPIVEKLWHMHHILCPVGETQDHIMVLASVKFRAEQFRSVEKLPCKHTEMTDIIVGTEIVNGVIRLKMHGQHLIDISALKGSLITVYVICVFLIDHLHILVQRAGMQNIIMIKKPDVLPRCHGKTPVGVPRDTLILFQFFIKDSSSAILLLIFPDNRLHISMITV